MYSFDCLVKQDTSYWQGIKCSSGMFLLCSYLLLFQYYFPYLLLLLIISITISLTKHTYSVFIKLISKPNYTIRPWFSGLYTQMLSWLRASWSSYKCRIQRILLTDMSIRSNFLRHFLSTLSNWCKWNGRHPHRNHILRWISYVTLSSYELLLLFLN